MRLLITQGFDIAKVFWTIGYILVLGWIIGFIAEHLS